MGSSTLHTALCRRVSSYALYEYVSYTSAYAFMERLFACTGTFAIVSIMVSVPIVDLSANPEYFKYNASMPNASYYEVDGHRFGNRDAFRISVATSLALLIGLLQVCGSADCPAATFNQFHRRLLLITNLISIAGF